MQEMQNQQWFRLIGKAVRVIVDDTAGGVVLFTREGLLEEACSVDERLKGCPAAVKDHFTLPLNGVGLKSGPYVSEDGTVVVIYDPDDCANLEAARNWAKEHLSPEVEAHLTKRLAVRFTAASVAS